MSEKSYIDGSNTRINQTDCLGCPVRQIELTSANVRSTVVNSHVNTSLVANTQSGTKGECFMRSRVAHLVIHFSVCSDTAVEAGSIPTGKHSAFSGLNWCKASCDSNTSSAEPIANSFHKYKYITDPKLTIIYKLSELPIVKPIKNIKSFMCTAHT